MTKIEEIKEAIATIYQYHQDPEMLNALLEDDRFTDIISEAKWNCQFGHILKSVCETETISGCDLNHIYDTILLPVARAVLRSHNSLDENPEEWEEGGKYLILEQLRLILNLQEQLEEWKNELKSIINEKI